MNQSSLIFIHSFMHTAPIVLRFSLAKTIHHFSERQYSILLEYNKIGTKYALLSDKSPDSWQLVEQK